MADLRKLSRELTRIYQRYGQKTQSKRGVPLYLTEYGYQTKPDPYAGRVVSYSLQAAWINQAEYIAYKNANVRAVNQFLLFDDAPDPAFDPKKQPNLAWRTFQSGLQLLAGKKKPSYKAYMTPLFLKQTRVRRGRSIGAVRHAAPGRARRRTVRAQLQFRSTRGKKWQRRKTITVGGPRHYFETRLSDPASGYVRISVAATASRTLTSRAAAVTSSLSPLLGGHGAKRRRRARPAARRARPSGAR